MKSKATRRDFLKLAGTLPLGFAASKTMQNLGLSHHLSSNGQQNFLILVFDAFSAYHISTYGYQRKTTPNLTRLSEQAIVYHNHYAGGNFTTPGTASLLTGTLPWTHRALQLRDEVIDTYETRNIFNVFKDHYSIAYTHNPLANILLEQFNGVIDELIPQFSLFIKTYEEVIHDLFKKDYDIASISGSRSTNINEDGYAYSLFVSHIYEAFLKQRFKSLMDEYPRGVPGIDRKQAYFLLDQALNWISARLTKIPQPFIGYFHFLPPHDPYRTSIEFVETFKNDGFKPLEKPDDIFSEERRYTESSNMRTQYDEYILYVDNQFNLFFEQLKSSGLLENTWVILTSDHGEMFERGIIGHNTDAMHQPLLRVPLMIFEPGRTKGENIFAPTSAIDILPTVLQIAGQEAPDWAEGKHLPPFAAQSPDMNRSIYAVRSYKTEKDDPITRSSLVHIKNEYKLHHYQGYTDLGLPIEIIRLFDVRADPEELVDLSDIHKDIASELLDELMRNLDKANKPYL